MHARWPGFRAQILFARPAPSARAATSRLPAYTDTLTRLEVLHCGTDGLYGPYDFVARNERKFADLPVVVNQMQIAAANTTMTDTNLYFVRTQLSGVIPVCKQFGPGSMCGISSDLWHRSSSVPSNGFNSG
jgi:hypothetical protein